jgi:16S rRNA (guanine966-N2)-methyltransferase
MNCLEGHCSVNAHFRSAWAATERCPPQPRFRAGEHGRKATATLRFAFVAKPGLIQAMRIIGGTVAGLILKAPKGYDVRPTSDLVRQAIFNSLGGRVVGACVVELFGGTGALSLECLSRGAVHALCIEHSAKHARLIEQNFALTRLPAESFQVRVQDVFVALQQLAEAERHFELILADPPFGTKNIGHRSDSVSQRLLDHTLVPQLLASGGLFVLGHAKRDTLSLPTGWRETKVLKHGDSMVRFLQVNSSKPP